MDVLLMVIGFVLMIVGIFIRPRDANWEWSLFFGLAGQSTWLGKTVAILGVIVLVLGGRMFISGETPSLFSSGKDCEANRAQIDYAKDQISLSEKLATGTELSQAQVERLIAFMKPGVTWNTIKCRSGGTYEIGKLGEPSKCSVHNKKQ